MGGDYQSGNVAWGACTKGHIWGAGTAVVEPSGQLEDLRQPCPVCAQLSDPTRMSEAPPCEDGRTHKLICSDCAAISCNCGCGCPVCINDDGGVCSKTNCNVRFCQDECGEGGCDNDDCSTRYCGTHAKFYDGANYHRDCRHTTICQECYKDGYFQHLCDSM
jgi:hypothetical protein